jgi:hypothetical protein
VADCFALNGATVGWASRKQSMVSTSTTEAEFNASAHACNEALLLHNLARDFGSHQDTADFFLLTTCALALIGSPAHHSRARHIDVQHICVRDGAFREEVKFMYRPTTEKIVDVLTKPLCASAFRRCMEGIGACAPPWRVATNCFVLLALHGLMMLLGGNESGGSFCKLWEL